MDSRRPPPPPANATPLFAIRGLDDLWVDKSVCARYTTVVEYVCRARSAPELELRLQANYCQDRTEYMEALHDMREHHDICRGESGAFLTRVPTYAVWSSSSDEATLHFRTLLNVQYHSENTLDKYVLGERHSQKIFEVKKAQALLSHIHQLPQEQQMSLSSEVLTKANKARAVLSGFERDALVVASQLLKAVKGQLHLGILPNNILYFDEDPYGNRDGDVHLMLGQPKRHRLLYSLNDSNPTQDEPTFLFYPPVFREVVTHMQMYRDNINLLKRISAFDGFDAFSLGTVLYFFATQTIPTAVTDGAVLKETLATHGPDGTRQRNQQQTTAPQPPTIPQPPPRLHSQQKGRGERSINSAYSIRASYELPPIDKVPSTAPQPKWAKATTTATPTVITQRGTAAQQLQTEPTQTNKSQPIGEIDVSHFSVKIDFRNLYGFPTLAVVIFTLLNISPNDVPNSTPLFDERLSLIGQVGSRSSVTSLPNTQDTAQIKTPLSSRRLERSLDSSCKLMARAQTIISEFFANDVIKAFRLIQRQYQHTNSVNACVTIQRYLRTSKRLVRYTLRQQRALELRHRDTIYAFLLMNHQRRSFLRQKAVVIYLQRITRVVLEVKAKRTKIQAVTSIQSFFKMYRVRQSAQLVFGARAMVVNDIVSVKKAVRAYNKHCNLLLTRYGAFTTKINRCPQDTQHSNDGESRIEVANKLTRSSKVKELPYAYRYLRKLERITELHQTTGPDGEVAVETRHVFERFIRLKEENQQLKRRLEEIDEARPALSAPIEDATKAEEYAAECVKAKERYVWLDSLHRRSHLLDELGVNVVAGMEIRLEDGAEGASRPNALRRFHDFTVELTNPFRPTATNGEAGYYIDAVALCVGGDEVPAELEVTAIDRLGHATTERLSRSHLSLEEDASVLYVTPPGALCILKGEESLRITVTSNTVGGRIVKVGDISVFGAALNG